MARYVWGVDSTVNVTNPVFECVMNKYGYPNFWGRYLTTVAEASEGLTRDEINFLRSKGVKILPIYNAFREAKGYRQGRIAANNAIFNARRLGLPKGIALFANIEKFFEVDDEWLRGWVEAIFPSGYKSGFYNDPLNGGFNQAFCQAVQENEAVKVQSILWSAQPEPGGTRPGMAPRFNPRKPNCGGNVWLWQYGRNVTSCPIDTNLADSRVLDSLG